MKLYRHFETQDELDAAYNPTVVRTDSAGFFERWTATSERACRDFPCRLGVRYGPTRAEHLDIFPAGAGAPVHIFVHGGYWRRFSAREHDFLAPAFVGDGIAFVSVNYALCPEVTIDEIVRQVRAAVAWVYANASDFGGNPDRITISGHSAGGHLVATTLSNDWPGVYDLPPKILKGALAISGLFDLAPFPYTFLQPRLQLTCEQVRRNSPILHVPGWPTCPLILAVGGREQDEFKRQAADYLAAWQGQGHEGHYLELAGHDHFTILDELQRPGSEVRVALSELIRH
jgi:arylformamidase